MPCPYFAFSTYPSHWTKINPLSSVDLNGLNGLNVLNTVNFLIPETDVWFVRSRSARP
jgi:hypothetical protein